MSFPRLPIDDELEIRSLIARYGPFADAGDPRFMDLFTEDATWTRANSPPAALGGSGLPVETLKGRDKLGAMMTEVMRKKFRMRVHHQMTDFYVEPGADGDEAVGYARALITDWRDGPGKIAMFGDYTLRFRRTSTGWRICDAVVRVLPD
ncbi:MAG: nuclear transport factor 2 family protein [Burkholderiaceae bacterium]|nr:nuclear transport factor 2 family protein [Burkholderiaceae bacterium]MDO9088698.1 nuclear transport factor 2 family protein [Burkholderiaceae bacterium]